jgi:3-methyladenine DNA glycosylase/8-oxoguanine DNA glycosylase
MKSNEINYNCSWALTKKISTEICSNFSPSVSPLGNYSFPSPKIISDLSESELRNAVPIGYRAPYLLLLAKEFLNNPDFIKLEDNKIPFDEAKKIVMNLKGFGSYASTHLLVMAEYYDEIPVDSVVKSYLEKTYGEDIAIPLLIESVYGKWNEYKWLGMKLDKMHRQKIW